MIHQFKMKFHGSASNFYRSFCLYGLVVSLSSCVSPKEEKGGTLFTEIGSEQSGINFVNALPFDKDFNIKSNNIELKGTILIPEKDNKKKLVIFVHGSGSSDRDETIFENKPFKDIAENLYSKGIASYRFDKRTYSNPETFKDTSTIDDEVTNDIINIISYFKNNKEFTGYEKYNC